MSSFFKSLSVFKLYLIELFAVFFFPVSATGLINEIRPGTFAAHHDLEGFEDWLFFFVGPFLMVLIMKDIFRPRIKVEGWIKHPLNIKFDFCSTHPSYILIDLWAIAFAGFFFRVAKSGDFELPVFCIMLGTAILIPLARLFAWFVLGLKINDPEVAEAHQPVLWAFIILLAAFGLPALISILI